MKKIISTHIKIEADQDKEFPLMPELLNLKLEKNEVKIAYIYYDNEPGSSTINFKMFKENETLDIDTSMYKYFDTFEYEKSDYHVFFRIISQEHHY